jgi:hypothetical protein
MGTLTCGVRRHGVIGSTVLAARHVAQFLSSRIYLHERHVWYVLRPAAVIRLPLGDKLALRLGGPEHVDFLSEYNLCSRSTALGYLARGGKLWLVREGTRLAFCCWIFTRQMPILAAPGGWLGLSSNTVCLEGSMTSSDYRGRGIAPAAWSLIAQELEEEGVRTIVTKIEECSAASRRAVLKIGFQEMAFMDYLCVGGLSRVQWETRSDLVTQDLEALRRVWSIAA